MCTSGVRFVFGLLGLSLAFALAGGAPAAADSPSAVVGKELATCVVHGTGVRHDRPAARQLRSADGQLNQWIGTPTGFAGAETYSRGEFIYEDHLWDAYGASGADGAARDAALDPRAKADPQLYRAQAVALYAPTGTA